MVCHVSTQLIHPRHAMHGENSRGIPNAVRPVERGGGGWVVMGWWTTAGGGGGLR